MWASTVLTGSSILLIAVAMVFLLLFLREPWWRHPFGRSVMVMTGGILLLSGLGLLTYLFGPDYAAREPLVVLGRLVIAVAIVQRTAVLIHERRKDRKPS